jgi:hypothetical protein
MLRSFRRKTWGWRIPSNESVLKTLSRGAEPAMLILAGLRRFDSRVVMTLADILSIGRRSIHDNRWVTVHSLGPGPADTLNSRIKT